MNARVILVIFLIFVLLITWMRFTRKRQIEAFKEIEIYKQETPYQTIQISNIDQSVNLGTCLILDNEVQLCSYDEKHYHELMIHFPVTYLPKLKRALVVGGGDMMNLRELMKYSTIESVVVLELDRSVTNACQKYFNIHTYEDDERVSIYYGDALKTINRLSPGTFDLVTIDLTEDSENNNPLNKASFLSKCKNMLNDRGILVMNGESNQRVLRRIFEYTNRYGTFLQTFAEYYQFVICSDSIDFSLRANLSRVPRWKRVPCTFYDRKKHRSYFSWYDLDRAESERNA